MSEEVKKPTYYQFRKEMELPIYVRFEDGDFEATCLDILGNLGFTKIEKDEWKDVSFDHAKTKVLKIVKATARVLTQINQNHSVIDKYGPESLTPRGNYDVYRYRGVGIMMLGHGNFYWELGLATISSQEIASSVKVILNRYLSWTLSSLGIVGFWGTPVDEGVVIMKQEGSLGEAIFFDMNQAKVMTADGVKEIGPSFSILRLSSELKDKTLTMKKEELISFLSTHTTYLSYSGLDYEIKKAILQMAQLIPGYIYPTENFLPRTSAAA